MNNHVIRMKIQITPKPNIWQWKSQCIVYGMEFYKFETKMLKF